MTERLLDQKTLRRAFELLALRLRRRGVVGEVHIFGGAAMVLAFNSRESTRDVDAVFAPDTQVIDAAHEVAVEMRLPKSWLNNQASSYVSGVAGRGTPVFDHPNLRVMITPTEHLLAMKVRAARAVRDADDIRVLLRDLEVTKVSQVKKIVEKYFVNEPLSARSLALIKEILSE
jgi:hypothetical protein